MNHIVLRLLSLLLTATLALAALGQDVRELSTPVPRLTYTGVSATSISNAVSNGYRLVDIEYRGPNLYGTTTYDAVFVQNTGQYQTTWWYYLGATASQLSSAITTNQARIIDLEPYQDSTGNLRFLAIMVDNTGANAKAWWWYHGTTTTYLGTQVAANNARIVDLDSYAIGSTTYYSGVMIRNTGTDARAWWWYTNATATQISGFLTTNQARLYDLERRSNGNWDCVMIQDVAPVHWYWWTDLQSSDIPWLLDNYGVRAISLESYLVGTQRRWAMLTINNSNYLTTTVGNLMRATTDGTVGCWLQQIGGPVLSDLNGTREFEPASTMKTVHHVAAMHRVELGSLFPYGGFVTLGSPVNVFTAHSPTSPSCPLDIGPITEPLHAVLRAMMEQSDNARTQAVTAFLTQSDINNTAAALSMANTQLNHRLGCAGDAIANPNRTTLRDLHWLHQAVANGYLGIYRDSFYDLMAESLSGLGLDAVITAEGASLGLPAATVASFAAFTKLAHKGGSYTLTSDNTYDHRAEFGWISLPFITSDVLTPREYGFGAFVNDASNGSNASAAVWTHAIPGLLRPTIRQALMSWNQSLAGVLSIGAGCGSPVFTQSVHGLPRLGATVDYLVSAGLPNAPTLLAVGFSSSQWGGAPLPASLVPIGSAPGCMAFNDVQFTFGAITGAAGQASFPITLANDPQMIGLRYLTQAYSFGSSPFLTSNSYRSIVGL